MVVRRVSTVTKWLLDDEHIPKVEMAACIAMQCVKCDVMQV